MITALGFTMLERTNEKIVTWNGQKLKIGTWSGQKIEKHDLERTKS